MAESTNMVLRWKRPAWDQAWSTFLAVAGNTSVTSVPSIKGVEVHAHKMLILHSSFSDYCIAGAEKHLVELQRSPDLLVLLPLQSS